MAVQHLCVQVISMLLTCFGKSWSQSARKVHSKSWHSCTVFAQ